VQRCWRGVQCHVNGLLTYRDNGAPLANSMYMLPPVPMMPTSDKTWDFLVKKLGPHKLGHRPRKMNADFATLLSDVIVSLLDTYNQPNNITVTRSCLNIIQTALKFYYIVPSAKRFREIVLMQNLCTGGLQRVGGLQYES